MHADEKPVPPLIVKTGSKRSLHGNVIVHPLCFKTEEDAPSFEGSAVKKESSDEKMPRWPTYREPVGPKLEQVELSPESPKLVIDEGPGEQVEVKQEQVEVDVDALQLSPEQKLALESYRYLGEE